jgi:alkylhydroperoxidase family enzyme
MSTFLPPVRRPRGPLNRVMYFAGRRMFGVVPTGTTVFTARMPAAFTMFYSKTYRLDRKLRLDSDTAAVIRGHVAALNTCTACMDIGRWYATRSSARLVERLDALPDYRTSPLFSAAERAALDYATELTTAKAVSPQTFDRLRAHYSEREICDLVWLVASEHLANITHIGLNIGSDGLCELAAAKQGRRPAEPPARRR